MSKLHEKMLERRDMAPWDGVGYAVANNNSMLYDAASAAGINFGVLKTPLYHENPVHVYKDAGIDPTLATLQTHQLLVRADTYAPLDIVTPTWKPLQVSTMLDVVEQFELAGLLSVVNMGILGGTDVYIVGKTTQALDVLGYEMRDYMLFHVPHRYGAKYHIKTCMTYVVCWNTLMAAIGEYSDFSYSRDHRVEFDSEEVKRTLFTAGKAMEKYKEQSEFLAGKRCVGVEDYFRAMLSISKDTPSRTLGTLLELYDVQPQAERGRGTWFAAYNAYTYYTNHIIGADPANRLHSTLFGASATKNRDALGLALTMARAA